MSDHINVRYVAHLARLHLSDEEVETFQPQLEQIMEHVHQLDRLDTEGVEPMAHPIAVDNVFREDEPRDSLPHETVMANAPAQAQGLILVPKIIE